MIDFVNFILKKVYNSEPIEEEFVNKALELTYNDVKYHFPEVTLQQVKNNITNNSNELAIFLFRLGNLLFLLKKDELTPQLHWLLKELCSCEIYFNNQIEVGFYVVHGEGTVIGSRNKIGKGFKIHQGCTIGHKTNKGGQGNTIGHNVTMYCNSSIIGELQIEDNVIIGAHTLVIKNISNNTIVHNHNNIQTKRY